MATPTKLSSPVKPNNRILTFAEFLALEREGRLVQLQGDPDAEWVLIHPGVKRTKRRQFITSGEKATSPAGK